MVQDHLSIENETKEPKPLNADNMKPVNMKPVNMKPVNGILSQASIIENGPLRIVITNSPSDATMEQHIRELVKFNVKHICRACEPTYGTAALKAAKIDVHDFVFPDGDPPSAAIIKCWLELIDRLFLKKGPEALKPTERISVHCVAGLGRAPVLVAVALIEGCGMEPLEAVQFIRKHRRGAINRKQLTWLEQYQPRPKTIDCGMGSCFGGLFGNSQAKKVSA